MESKDVVGRVIGILMILVIILVLMKIDVTVLARYIGKLYPLTDIIRVETVYLWRERVFDTILQAVAILVGLIGVLVLVIWGERRG